MRSRSAWSLGTLFAALGAGRLWLSPRGAEAGGERAAAARPRVTGSRAAQRGSDAEARMAAASGEPALFAVALSAVGSSLYFVLGVVAGDALGLTPAGVPAGRASSSCITMLTYVEGNSLHPERGGASTFARYAFNELWSFVAGWAMLLDYLIVMAIGAFAVSHYLAAFWGVAGDAGAELAIAGATIAFTRVPEHPRHHRRRGCGTVLRISLVEPGALAGDHRDRAGHAVRPRA